MTVLNQGKLTSGRWLYGFTIIVFLCLVFILGITCPSYGAGSTSQTSSSSFSREQMIEKGFSAWASKDGGYIFASYSVSELNSTQDLLLIKTSSEGRILWQKTYGGNGDEQANAIRETGDGGYIVCGYTTSIKEKGKDIYLLKLKANGDVEWEKNYGGRTETEKRSETTSSQILTNGFNVKELNSSKGLSRDYYDVFVLVTDESSEETTQDNGSYTEDEGIAVTCTSDGGYVVAGYSRPTSGSDDICLMKVDFRGVLQWVRSLGGGSDDRPNCIEECKDKGFIIAGYTRSVGLGSRERSRDKTADRSDKDVYLIKTDDRGYKEWEKTYGGTNDDEATCIVEDEWGYAIGAYSIQDNNTSNPGILLIQTDRYGNLKWQDKIFSSSKYQFPMGIQSLPGGAIALAGNISSSRGSEAEAFVMKYNQQGGRVWERQWKGNGFPYIYGLLVKDDKLVLYGTMTSIDTNQKGRSQLNPMLLEYNFLGQLLHRKSVAGSQLKSAILIEQGEEASSSESGLYRTPPESPMQKGRRGSINNE